MPKPAHAPGISSCVGMFAPQPLGEVVKRRGGDVDLVEARRPSLRFVKEAATPCRYYDTALEFVEEDLTISNCLR
jgi:hypothetical protein